MDLWSNIRHMFEHFPDWQINQIYSSFHHSYIWDLDWIPFFLPQKMKRLASQTSKLKTNMSTQFHFSFTAVNISYCQGQRITGNELEIIKGLWQRNIYIWIQNTPRDKQTKLELQTFNHFIKNAWKTKAKLHKKIM